MEYLSLVLAVIALVIAILAYQKAGGMADLKNQIEQIAASTELKKSVESLAAASDTLKVKTAEAIGKLEAAFKGAVKKEKKPPKKAAPKKRTRRAKPKAKTEKTEAPS